ncbi:protein of unknown function [Micromonospora nigra]|uniref:DUF305 domain-containing protein n=1 Tax=Micromonospora nigra TaxID=145857 RepID=A0A1C6RXP5_9ACTN|nr:DUF305 domain-containing protein [Micromonospora nigra]SCL21979.1 protein of unknown function [Micromonospora nigra]
MDERNSDGSGRGKGMSHETKMYLRFGAMILTAMVVMYGVMYLSTWRWSDIRFSESRMFMAFAMGGTMGLVMLGWMRNMYSNTKANLGIVAASILLFGTGVVLDRSQATVDGIGWMNSMIPHHSMAITRSERADIEDVRVCRLAVEISEAQRREISEMKWLIEDIRRNGVAETPEEAQARPVPEFDASASRQCPGG